LASEPFLPVYEVDLDGNEETYVLDCLRSGQVSSLGAYVERFEGAFAHFCGTDHAVATTNGTAALHLVLAALGLGPGDEVLVPALTFVATANAVRYTGAHPVFVDSDPVRWTLSPEDLERRIGPRSRAVIAVHLYGRPANMAAIAAVARAHGLWVVEDAAQAHGAEIDGKRVGSFGVAGTFSFFGNKLMTSGEGGMITLGEPTLRQRLASLRYHAVSPRGRYWHDEIGFNYRMTNVQGAIGLAQLERLEARFARKEGIGQRYRALLDDVRGISLPEPIPGTRCAPWMYTVLVDEGFPLSRDALAARLLARGIDTRPFFHPISSLPAYRSGERHPVAEALAGRGLCLPSSPRLSQEQIERVAGAVREAARG
jgi:perosamine synthetase